MAEVSNPEALAVGIYDRGCIYFEEKTLTSGLASPVYFNLRVIGSIDRRSQLSYIEQIVIRDRVIDAYAQQLATFGAYDHIIGVPLMGGTIAGLLGQETAESVLTERPHEKTHGMSKPIEGSWYEDESIVMVDDVLSTAKSFLQTKKKIDDLGLNAVGAAVLIDRGQGGRENLAAEDVPLEAALGVATLIDILRSEGRITSAQEEIMRGYFLKESSE